MRTLIHACCRLPLCHCILSVYSQQFWEKLLTPFVFLKMLQAAKCTSNHELAFQTLCQSVQNADAVCLARTWGFICSALVAMIYEKSAGKEERGVELLKHVCLGGKGLKVVSMALLV